MSKASPRKSRTTGIPSRRKAPDVQPSTPAAARSTDSVARRQASHDDIARRAYALFQERGGQHGDDLADWLRAEAELTARSGNGGNGGRRQP
jgi:hypothetical protein